MNEPLAQVAQVAQIPALQVLLIGLIITLAALAKGWAARFNLPSLVFFLIIGFLLRLADDLLQFMSPAVLEAFELLANLGLVALLFDVGLRSNPRALARKLPAASLLWIGNMIGAFSLGFLTVRLWFGMDLLPALLVGTALSATSVGVALGAWQDANAMDSANGRLTLDVAELDDIAGIAMMALVFSLIPVLGNGGNLWLPLGSTLGWFLFKFLAFTGLCWFIAHQLEWRLTQRIARFEQPPERMLIVIGIGFMIAALAGWLGFSLAIGALFAGLVFSRDPIATQTEVSFQDLSAFLTPFFFVHIGFFVDPASLIEASQLGGWLLLAAVLGKLIGVGLPALWVSGASGAVLIGISMIPRAEIAMIVMHQGRSLGDQIISSELYSGMVLVAGLTCLLSPLALRPLLKRWPQPREQEA